VYNCLCNNDILLKSLRSFLGKLKSLFNLANDKPRLRHLIPSCLVYDSYACERINNRAACISACFTCRGSVCIRENLHPHVCKICISTCKAKLRVELVRHREDIVILSSGRISEPIQEVKQTTELLPYHISPCSFYSYLSLLLFCVRADVFTS